MQSFMGRGYRISKNPYWFNANTGEIVTTGNVHHSKVFASDPGILGIAADEVASKYDGELYAMAYATVMLRHGWCRIDICDGTDRTISRPTAYPPGTVSVNAPNVGAANDAIREALRLTRGSVPLLIVVIAPRATKDAGEAITLGLSGRELQEALSNGIDRLAADRRPQRIDDAAFEGRSKMAADRCPFGFGRR